VPHKQNRWQKNEVAIGVVVSLSDVVVTACAPLYFLQTKQVDMNETTQQAIVQTLREKILSGELAPGQRLVEAQIAQWLGVSRSRCVMR